MNTGPATFPRERNGSGWSQGNRMVYRGSGGWTNWPWSSNSIAWNWDYEFYGIALPVPDGDHDGVPDASDNCPTIANPTQADCNGNGIGDACELAAGAPDCNNNTIPDSCELAAGTALDCNTNTIPDACDITGGAPDFNLDTVPDTCQCVADLFVDHQVNGADLGALLAFWGPVNSGFPQADVNRDGQVNGADLGYLLNAWGPCTN